MGFVVWKGTGNLLRWTAALIFMRQRQRKAEAHPPGNSWTQWALLESIFESYTAVQYIPEKRPTR